MSPSPAVQELILAVARILVVVVGLLTLFAVMTWVERRTLGFMQYRLGPPFFSVPKLANHSAPRVRMRGTFTSVSTLLTMVGQP